MPMKTHDTPIATQETTHVCPKCGDGVITFAIDNASFTEAWFRWHHACGYEQQHSKRVIAAYAVGNWHNALTEERIFADMERLYQANARHGLLLPGAAAPQAQAAE